MPSIEILDSGRLDDRDSAFPQATQLPDGDVLCSFSVGGGALVTGGTDWARSADGGATWSLEGTILPPTDNPRTVNFLKLSLSADGKTVFAYGSRGYPEDNHGFGRVKNEAIVCRYDGANWSEPTVIPFGVDCPMEISHGILPLSSGRLLAPSAPLPAADRLAEQVLVAISDDNGHSWPRRSVMFQDPNGELGYFEQKLAEIGPDRVVGVCWTVTLGDYKDRPNSFAVSEDGGLTWSLPESTGIEGQTMTPLSLGGDRLLVLYNRRYGDQGIVMALVNMTASGWEVVHEGLMYDASERKIRPSDSESGLDELEGFEFGFLTAIRLHDGTVLATNWSRENGVCGIRWTKLRIDWQPSE